QLLALLAAPLWAAEARETQPDIPDPNIPQERRQQRDRLGVDRGVLRAERLRPHLPELAVAPGLRALVAEEAREVPQLDRLAALVHAVLDIGPAHGRRALRPQRQHTPGATLKVKHLLPHEVVDPPTTARKQLVRLERRRPDPLIAGTLEDRRARD